MSRQSPLWPDGCVMTIGNFDGVHLGHRSLIERLVDMGKNLGVPTVVFTFDPPPLRLLKPQSAPKPLTWNKRRESLLKKLGVDFVHFYPTDHQLLSLSPQEFFERILIDQLRVRGMVEGPNFKFGKDRAGDTRILSQLCQEHQVELEIAEPKSIGDKLVSSTQIREWVEQGELQQANTYLVEPYRISGTVGHGAARGRTLGFPTANLENIEVLIPAHGVYAARVTSPDHLVKNPVALHIGPNPTFGENATKVEAHLLDFHGDLYGMNLELEILTAVRGVQKFQSKEELLHQLHRDIQQVRSVAC